MKTAALRANLHTIIDAMSNTGLQRTAIALVGATPAILMAESMKIPSKPNANRLKAATNATNKLHKFVAELRDEPAADSDKE